MQQVPEQMASQYFKTKGMQAFSFIAQRAPFLAAAITKTYNWSTHHYKAYGYQIETKGSTPEEQIGNQITDLCKLFNWLAPKEQELKNYYLFDKNPNLPPLEIRQKFFRETLDVVQSENRNRRDFAFLALGQGLVTQPFSVAIGPQGLLLQVPLVLGNLHYARKAWVYRNRALEDLEEGMLQKPEDPGPAPRKPFVARLPLLLGYLFPATWRHRSAMTDHAKEQKRFENGTAGFHDWQVERYASVFRREREYAIVKAGNAATMFLSAGAPLDFSTISYVPPGVDYILDTAALTIAWPFNLATTWVAGKGVLSSKSASGAAKRNADEMQRESSEDFRELWLRGRQP